MKHTRIIILFALSLAGFLMTSCDKVEDKVTLTGSTPPQLTVSSSSDLVLQKARENYSSLQFSWTNPNYTYSNGVNTQDVNYLLQIDTTGSNFSNPKSVNLGFVKELSTAFTVKELNTALSGMELKDFVSHAFEFRIKATLFGGSAPVYSNVVKINITTYLDVVYPVPDKLYITGAATPGNWMGGGDAELVAQRFNKVNAYTFVIESLNINASSGYLFVPVYGDWSHKYGFTGSAQGNNPAGDTFKPEGNDFVSPATAKAYKITVNFKTGKFSFE
ncbi:MAG: SusE domain-containing protein [Cyclobacteriaceae bacterium]|nr:SusE domain-containing protein [Cyclobacteriaceae bacterium]